MEFELTAKQKAVQQATREFAQREIAPIVLECDREERFPIDVYKKMAKLGMVTGTIPSKYGGVDGMDHISVALQAEELGYYSLAFAGFAMAKPLFFGKLFLAWGTEEQRQKYLPALCRGEIILSTAVTEAQGGTDVSTVTTEARAQGDKYILNGKKVWISSLIADYFVVVARMADTEKPRYSVFVVERGLPGLSTTAYTNKLGYRSDVVGEVLLENCTVTKEALVGQEGQGLRVILSLVENNRLAVAARCCGALRACLDMSMEYARQRVVFGNPIGRYQLIQNMIAEMATNLDCGRLLAYRLAWLKDKEVRGTTRESSMAKRFTTDALMKGATDTVQILGAYGCSNDHRAAMIFRDAKCHQILEGTNQIHTVLIGEICLGYRKA